MILDYGLPAGSLLALQKKAFGRKFGKVLMFECGQNIM
jgi:hypothetical protein